MEPTENERLIEQVRLMGQAVQAWYWSSDTLHRGADVLIQVARAGSGRLIELSFQDPPPAPGEIHRRSVTPEEVGALVDSHLQGVSVLLLAYAVECRLKAALLKKGASLVSPEGVLQKQFKHHKLRRLAVDAGVALPEADLQILDGLTAFLEWRGRYPIPTKWERLRDLTGLDLGSIGQFTENAFALSARIAAQLGAA